MINKLCMWTLAAGAAAVATAAESPTIERLAPRDTIFVASVPDAKQAVERFKGTGLWALWQSEALRQLREKFLESMQEGTDELFKELGVEEGEMPTPQGPLGLAVFTVEAEAGGAPGGMAASPASGFLLVADFGGEADRADQIVSAGLQKLRDKHEVVIDEDEVLGRTVRSFDVPHAEEEAEGDFEEFDEFGGPPMMPAAGPEEFLEKFEKIHIVRDGTRFLASSDRAALAGALEAIDGEESGFGRQADFQAVTGQLGRGDGYAVLRLGAALDVAAAGNPMAATVVGMARSVLGDIQSIGLGFRFDAPQAMVEEKIFVYMPNGKEGLAGLFDVPSPRASLPPFVGPDVMSYSTFNFKFDSVIEFLRTVGRTNPFLGMQIIDPLLAQYGPTIEQICSAAGPQVHMVDRLERPVTATSQKSVAAIRSENPARAEEALARHAGELGFEPRDFLGQRIYTAEANPFTPPMPVPVPVQPGPVGDESFSIGFGAGYVVMGPTSQVEDVLRAGGGGRLPSLTDNPAYARAVAVLSGRDSVAWGVASTADYVEAIAVMFKGAMEADPEAAGALDEDLGQEVAASLRELDIDLVRRHFGPSAWQLQSHDDGFLFTSYLLPALEE